MVLSSPPHQYIERESQNIITENLIGDRSISFIYNRLRESAPVLFKALTSARMSSLLSIYHYDFLDRKTSNTLLFEKLNTDWQECVEPLSYYDTARKVFERQIRYWDLRPIDKSVKTIVSPADSRVLIGSLSEISNLFIKEKLFTTEELLGIDRKWSTTFKGGDFAVFRLTPDKYHYNHSPVSGTVLDIYEIDGHYHSCNPAALISIPSIHAKNKRVVTVIDTDVENGSNAGLVAMIEVVALMIGDIKQAYSNDRYRNPRPIKPGMFLEKGCPKSLYRPGSSTDILIFEQGKISFSEDLIHNSRRNDVESRFSNKLVKPLVETDVQVRSTIGYTK